jgi:hypothetical protein
MRSMVEGLRWRWGPGLRQPAEVGAAPSDLAPRGHLPLASLRGGLAPFLSARRRWV